uniref:Uncharacterized protein n=1 Tax=Talaromyces marneffei PM1 TaxID=1077442 RepID=A0A093VAL9_TALMA
MAVYNAEWKEVIGANICQMSFQA